MRRVLAGALLAMGCGRLGFAGAGDGSAGDTQPSAYATAVLSDIPELYWRFEESLGSVIAVDSSGHGRDGVYAGMMTVGVPGALTGEPDRAIAFHGDPAGNVALADTADLGYLGPFTLEAWVRLNASDGSFHWICGKGTNAVDVPYSIAFQWDTLKFQRDAAPSSWEGPWFGPFPYAVYRHVAATFDGSTMMLYVDGALAGQNNATLTVQSGPAPFSVGDNLDGDVDEVAVYSYPLSAARVMAHYNAAAR